MAARRNLLFTAMSLPALLGSGHAVAQEATTTLDPINVQERVESAFGPVDGYVATQGSTATKTDTPLIETPQSISVVTADQIAAQGVESIGNAMRYTAGVAGEMWGNDTRGYGLQIRGFDVWDESFYKDGLRLKGTDFATFLSLDPYGAERIEVLHGPASVLYGQNSPGGIINYVSKRPTDETFREIEVSAGSFNRYQAQFGLAAPWPLPLDEGVRALSLQIWTDKSVSQESGNKSQNDGPGEHERKAKDEIGEGTRIGRAPSLVRTQPLAFAGNLGVLDIGHIDLRLGG